MLVVNKLNKESMINSAIVFMFVLFHIFNLKINFPPYNLILISAFFSFFFIFLKKFNFNPKFYIVLFFIFIQLLVLLVSFLINQNVDFFFFKESILYEIVSVFSSYFITNAFFGKSEDRFNRVCFFIFIAVAFQLVLSFLGYINSSIFNVLFAIFDLGDENIISHLSEERMVGVGASFFGSGVIDCLILVLIASFIVTEKKSRKKIYLLMVYFIVAILGMLSARTTSVGIVLSLIIIFVNFKNIKLKFFLFSCLLFFIFLLSNVNSFSDTKLGNLLNFSIGFLMDFKGSNASNSTSDLVTMYSKLPDNIKTWLIGDTLYRDGYGYYKGTDIGYFRFIFATGLLGLVIYCLFIIYLVFNIDSERVTLFSKFLIILLFFVLMGKGVTIFFPILLLLYFSSNRYATKSGKRKIAYKGLDK